MRRKLLFEGARRVWIGLAVSMVCLVSLVCLGVPNGSGWVMSEIQDCEREDHVCAEWELEEGEPWASCCIDPKYLGDPTPSACDSSFRHFHNSP